MRRRQPRERRYLIQTIALWLAVSSGAAAAPKWTQLQSENFLFIGDASEGQIRRVAERLEQFRDALLRVLPGNPSQSQVPTVVVVFDTDRSMTPVKPLFRGQPIEVAGYFQGGEDLNYIAVNAEDLDVAVPTIFHEYAHFLVGDRQGDVPVWVNEGLAELYSTTEQMDGGKSVLIGRAPGKHVALLQSSTLMPINQLLAVDHSAAIYNEGSRRGVLYAQSWALVHYLTLGNSARAPQFRKYLSALQAGSPPAPAFAAAFGDDAALLDRELFDYVRSFTFPALQLRFAEQSGATSVPRGKALAENDADAYLADIQARINRVDEARKRVDAIQKRDPKAARAFLVLGAMDLRANRPADAVAQLEKAAALAPDDFILQSTYGRSLIRQMSEVRNDRSKAAAILPHARQALGRATTINPRSAQAAYLLAYAELVAGDLSVAVTSLTRAAQLNPRRDEYRMLLVQAHLRQREYDKAATLLGPLMATGRTGAVRDEARRLMGNLADMRLAREALPNVAMPPPVEASEPAGARPDGNRAGMILRIVQPGELRVLGTLEAIDCAGGRVVLRIAIEGRTLALSAKQFSDVDFISYRSAAPGEVTCGPQKSRDRVYATYRPDAAAAGIDGLAVAIELLPEDFTPPKP